ncbi:MAG: hypothetical protein M1482_11540, partial [Chloroflexi bacterium]|nr:hypothetical protein [Chloroflexota bacterium]
MTSQPTPDLSRSRPGRGSYLLFAAASLWVAAAAVSVQVVAWLADQILIITGIYLPAYAWPLLSWADLALVAVAVVPLAWFSRSVRFRSVYRAWGLCLAFAALVAPARFFSTSQLQPASLAYVVLSLGGCIALVRFAPAGLGRGFRRDGVALLAGSAAGVLVVAPMIVFGALGSLTDTLLTLCAGFSLGLFAGLLLSAFLLTALDQDESKPSSIFVGWSAAVALTILAIGFGPPGSNLLLAAVLPPLGFAVAGIGRIVGAERSWIAAAGLVGAAGAAVLMFFDPTELALVLSLSSGGETLAWALRAAGASMLLGLVLGLIALVAGARRLRIPRASAARGAAL